MNEFYEALLELQELDQEIDRAEARLSAFDEQLATLDEPALVLEQEVEGLRGKLTEMRQEQQRRERGAEEKRETLRRYEERLERVRNAREEAAAKTELDLVRRAAEADDEDTLGLMDQVRRTDLKIDELQGKLDDTRGELQPQREGMLAERKQVEDELAVLRDKRENQAVRLPDQARRLYERLRSGRTRSALAKLTADGACGFCFGVVPIQRQSEIRRGDSLVRCEACGMILYPGES